jgi:hypothetical protein
VDEDAPRRFAAHARAALRPGGMPGIEEAAEDFNAARAARAG